MASHELTEEEYKSEVANVWKVTILLAVVTLVEVAVALVWFYFLEDKLPRLMLNGLMIVASLLKAYFIIGEFMHLKYERRAFMLSILVPLVLFIWGILAFLAEGSSVRALRELFSI